jgi:hypothetical protein
MHTFNVKFVPFEKCHLPLELWKEYLAESWQELLEYLIVSVVDFRRPVEICENGIKKWPTTVLPQGIILGVLVIRDQFNEYPWVIYPNDWVEFQSWIKRSLEGKKRYSGNVLVLARNWGMHTLGGHWAGDRTPFGHKRLPSPTHDGWQYFDEDDWELLEGWAKRHGNGIL